MDKKGFQLTFETIIKIAIAIFILILLYQFVIKNILNIGTGLLGKLK